MKLSELVYLAIKNVVYQSDASFDYISFMKGDFDNDTDFKMQIVNAFSPLNEAIARLSDLDRIPNRFHQIHFYRGNSISTETFEHPVKEIVGVHDGRQAYGFRVFGKVIRLDTIVFDKDLFIEYKENIKSFSYDDLVELEEDEFGNITDNNIDLNAEYGFTEGICSYIVEYVKGKLLEPIAPEIANMHISTAESYFSNIDPNRPATIQGKVQTKFTMGE